MSLPLYWGRFSLTNYIHVRTVLTTNCDPRFGSALLSHGQDHCRRREAYRGFLLSAAGQSGRSSKQRPAPDRAKEHLGDFGKQMLNYQTITIQHSYASQDAWTLLFYRNNQDIRPGPPLESHRMELLDHPKTNGSASGNHMDPSSPSSRRWNHYGSDQGIDENPGQTRRNENTYSTSPVRKTTGRDLQVKQN